MGSDHRPVGQDDLR